MFSLRPGSLRVALLRRPPPPRLPRPTSCTAAWSSVCLCPVQRRPLPTHGPVCAATCIHGPCSPTRQQGPAARSSGSHRAWGGRALDPLPAFPTLPSNWKEPFLPRVGCPQHAPRRAAAALVCGALPTSTLHPVRVLCQCLCGSGDRASQSPCPQCRGQVRWLTEDGAGEGTGPLRSCSDTRGVRAQAWCVPQVHAACTHTFSRAYPVPEGPRLRPVGPPGGKALPCDLGFG